MQNKVVLQITFMVQKNALLETNFPPNLDMHFHNSNDVEYVLTQRQKL
jgi:hypothetical protein